MKDATGRQHGARVKGAGPWPFITFHSYSLAGRHIVWRDRQHRKGLDRESRALETVPIAFWQTQIYNWYVGLIFAAGSFLFMLGSALSLIPGGAGVPLHVINSIFFAGSVPFTTAAYMQHLQAANASAFALDPASHMPRNRPALLGWHPHSPGWLSTFTQFVGTLAFNINTYDTIHAPSRWYMQDIAIWLPDMVGSILFLVSAYLAFIEAGHGYWSWNPRRLDWQIVFINLLGCIAFMTAAVLAYVPRGPEAAWIMNVSTAHLFVGALCFFVGAVLSMRESRQASAE
ncbi:hypothetical protein [Ancylobacter pratisalsi]|uniref:YrhK domain-containing protein n=1 Tax=Ancylobacter pratisalsi TaxID=1745854 RepID=A0A6P1YQ14_9HYPH|nr:hypothetical protein [Ancylobacter pratisalsi]QIB35557.1 hypothetical protein G3A50_18975 [Ancylobacter pratisalsi]